MRRAGDCGSRRFTGLQNARNTADYYALAGCFVLPSAREPWGLVVNEAMASGLPVLVSVRCGCAEDLVRANGLMFDPHAPDGLRRCLTIVGALAAGDLEAMGERSRRIIAHYSPGVWAEGGG